MNDKNIPTNDLWTRLFFAYRWDYSPEVLKKGVSDLFFELLQGLVNTFYGIGTVFFCIFGLILAPFIWMIRPLLLTIFKPRGVDHVIALKLSPKK